jgi:hypothetical protein
VIKALQFVASAWIAGRPIPDVEEFGGIDLLLDKCKEVSSIKEQEEMARLLSHFVS